MSDITKACRDINELNPLAQIACRLFMQQCEKEGIDIFITETYRSQARQDYLYESGRTREGSILTNAKVSNHTGKMAWDIACNGKVLYDNNMLAEAGAVARKLGITWGGDWKGFVDKPHFEITSKWIEPKIEEEPEVRFNNINEIPDYAKTTIQKMIDCGAFGDTSALDLSLDMIRSYVFLDRMGKL